MIAGAGGFDKSCRAEAEALAPEHGLTVVADESTAQGDTDVTPQLTRIKGTRRARRCCSAASAPSTWSTRNFAPARRCGMPLYYNHGVRLEADYHGSGGAAEGVRVPCAALLVADQLPPGRPRSARRRWPTPRRTRRPTTRTISTFGGYAYDGLICGRRDQARRRHRPGQGPRRARADQGLRRRRRHLQHDAAKITWASTSTRSRWSRSAAARGS